jgi:hypothetical protein
MTTAEMTRTATFVSRGENTRLTIVPSLKRQVDVQNRIITQAFAGEHVQFEKSFAVITPDPVDADKSRINGSQLVNMPFDELVTWMRAHELFNAGRERNGCYWEEGNAPDEPKPSLADQMKALAQASALNDLGMVDEVREAEQETHQRVAILQACDEAEKTIRLIAEPLDTEPQAEAEGEGEPDESGSEEDAA